MSDPFNPNAPLATSNSNPMAANTPMVPGLGGEIDFGEIDLEGVESASLVEPGSYPMFLEEIEPGTTKNGDPKLVFHFRIFNHDKYNNRRFSLHCAIVPNALFRLKEVQEALGQAGGKFRPSTSMYNTVVVGKVKNNEYEGSTRSQLDRVLAPPAAWGAPGMKKP